MPDLPVYLPNTNRGMARQARRSAKSQENHHGSYSQYQRRFVDRTA